MNAFSIFYFLVLGFLWILALPILFFLTCKKKYKISIPKRFFLWKNPPFKDKNIWFHACSFGEVKSLKPIFDKLNLPINISTTTKTGYDEAKKMSKNVRFLPFEIFLPFWIKQNDILIVTEAELWFMLFYICKLKKAKTFLINARISDNSYKNYKKFSWLYKKIFQNIDFIFAQTKLDKQRLEEFGAKNISISGNIKTASILKPTKMYQKPQKRVITLASTHENEEELILKNLNLTKNDMLIIAPRHPERFLHVRKIANEFAIKNSLTCKNFSQSGFAQCDILVCDTLGELINIYAISDICILCGSFLDGIGGHNPLEPAFFNNILISGKYIFNQKALYPLVENVYFCELNEISILLESNLIPSSLHVRDTMENIIKQIWRNYER